MRAFARALVVAVVAEVLAILVLAGSDVRSFLGLVEQYGNQLLALGLVALLLGAGWDRFSIKLSRTGLEISAEDRCEEDHDRAAATADAEGRPETSGYRRG